MQNQLLTETAPETIYAPPAVAQTDLATVETKDAQTEQAVHQWLTKIQRKTRRKKIAYYGSMIFFQAFLFVPILSSNHFPAMKNGVPNLLWLALLFAPAIGMLTLVLRTFLSRPGWDAAEIKRVGGVQAVGPLVDLIAMPKAPRQLPPLCAALTELLPQMQASDAGLLTKKQRKTLNWLLTNGIDWGVGPTAFLNLRLAILKAWEQIGDAAAIPTVAHLASGRARTADQKTLKAAAQECLPLLQAHFGEVEATKTLLRASAPENAAPETLLRPADFTPDAAPQQLLRAANPGSDAPQP